MRYPFVTFLARHCLGGVGAGWITVALLLWLDVAGVGTLVFASEVWPVPLAMLLVGFGVTFGSVAMGAAVMSIGHAPEGEDGLGARPELARVQEHLPVRALAPVARARLRR